MDGRITFETIEMLLWFIPALPSMFYLLRHFLEEKKREREIVFYIHSLKIYNSRKHIIGSEKSCVRYSFERTRSIKNRLSFFNVVFFKNGLVFNLNKSPLGKNS